jgi:hypothetical protein
VSAVSRAAVILCIVMTPIGMGAPAAAHHGFSGRYDRSQPLYAEGVITMSAYSLPHGLITIRPSPPTPPPPDLSTLDERSYLLLGGREVVTRTRPLEATGGGVLTLLLPPPMTTTVATLPAPPARGDTVGAIVFRECDTGELRVQLLRISAQERVLRSGVIQREVDGCTGPAAPQIVTVPPTATAVARLSPVPVETKEQADQWSLLTLLAIASGAAAVAFAVGLILARRG